FCPTTGPFWYFLDVGRVVMISPDLCNQLDWIATSFLLSPASKLLTKSSERNKLNGDPPKGNPPSSKLTGAISFDALRVGKGLPFPLAPARNRIEKTCCLPAS